VSSTSAASYYQCWNIITKNNFANDGSTRYQRWSTSNYCEAWNGGKHNALANEDFVCNGCVVRYYYFNGVGSIMLVAYDNVGSGGFYTFNNPVVDATNTLASTGAQSGGIDGHNNSGGQGLYTYVNPTITGALNYGLSDGYGTGVSLNGGNIASTVYTGATFAGTVNISGVTNNAYNRSFIFTGPNPLCAATPPVTGANNYTCYDSTGIKWQCSNGGSSCTASGQWVNIGFTTSTVSLSNSTLSLPTYDSFGSSGPFLSQTWTGNTIASGSGVAASNTLTLNFSGNTDNSSTHFMSIGQSTVVSSDNNSISLGIPSASFISVQGASSITKTAWLATTCPVGGAVCASPTTQDAHSTFH
jgi:hypothetical protein